MKNRTPLAYLTLFLCFIVLFLCSSCQNNEEQFSNLEKKLEYLLEEKNIDFKTAVDNENANQVADEEELVEISNSVVRAVSNGKINDALDIIQKHSPLPKIELDKLREQTIKQLQLIKPRFGEYVGFEFISSEKIGKSIIRHDCIVKCENHILRWEFYYYKPKEKWFLNAFKWDDNIRLLKNG